MSYKMFKEDKKNILAIIPARSGSKGLKNKNVKDLLGKPLMAYSIEAAQKSNIFDKIIVSTDSEKYAEIATKFGAEIPELRPDFISNDSSTSIDVVLHCIDFYEKRKEKFDIVCLLQPTSPLRTASDIQDAYKLFYEKGATSIVSVCECDHSPLWTGQLDETLEMKDFIKENVKNMPRQKLKKYFRLNGAIYLTEVDYLKKEKKFIGEKTFAYIMSRKESIDIDCFDDFEYVEFIMKQKQRAEKL